MTSPAPDSTSRSNTTSLIAILVALLLGALVAVAGSQGGATLGGIPLFALAVAAAFAIQIIAFIPAAILRNERFFDLTGLAFTKHHIDTWIGARHNMNMSTHVHF